MRKTALIIILLLIFLLLPTPLSAWDDCPYGLENDPYPGECNRYVDTDGDGICDHSQLAPEDRGDAISNEESEIEESEISIVSEFSFDEEIEEGEHAVENENTAIENTSNSTKQRTKSSQNPYNFMIPFLIVVISYLLWWYLTTTSYAKKYNWLASISRAKLVSFNVKISCFKSRCISEQLKL